ncbi:uncharacterized protein LOC127286941 [Leptopilina boulardi]|uniref:uncharacterized protein LOC127286941 n=1 Tax=Leptopilina boulardi TaxID=63433 RepID=UPI0021F5D3C4|nr:uncharacterized protein LOC127286941 [Leptopilina boulardi]
MEVDSENIQKKTKHFGRNLRKRRNVFISKKTVKHRTRRSKILQIRKSVRRHKSLEALDKHNLSENAQNSLMSLSSATSIGSVIYLGYYRKIPQLITLDDNNDSVKIQNENKLQQPITDDKTIKASSTTLEENTSEEMINNSSDIQHTNYLLELLNDMCVGSTNKRTTRTRVRRGKNLTMKKKVN